MATGQEPTNVGGAGRPTGRTRPADDARRLKDRAAEVAQEAKQRGKERLEAGKSRAADQVQQLAGAVDRAAGELREQDNTLARYAGELASGVSRFAEGLRNRSIEELASDVQSLARRNPTVFVLGSVALGVALARFLKASAQRESEQSQWSPGEQARQPDETAIADSQGPGTELSHTFTAPAGSTGSPLHPPAAGAGFEREDL